MQRAAVAVATLLMMIGIAAAKPSRPAWTKAKPRFETRGGVRVAVAVGKGDAKANRALAQAEAEARARSGLLRLIKGASRHDSVEGYVKGAQVVAVFEAPKGVVYVRLEMPMDDAPTP